ncbi:unnamed protein product [Rotaria magnacalcarata]
MALSLIFYSDRQYNRIIHMEQYNTKFNFPAHSFNFCGQLENVTAYNGPSEEHMANLELRKNKIESYI